MTKPKTDPAPGPTERQPRETGPAFEAFRIYLEMGRSRSTAKVAQELGKSKTLIDRWSSRWSWSKRVRAFESKAAASKDDAHLDAIARTSHRQAEIAQRHVEATAIVADEIIRRFVEEPEKARAELRKVPLERLLGLEPTQARAGNRGTVTYRLALGLTTEQDGEPLPRSEAEDRARRLTDEELDAQLAGVDDLAVQREKREQRKAAADG